MGVPYFILTTQLLNGVPPSDTRLTHLSEREHTGKQQQTLGTFLMFSSLISKECISNDTKGKAHWHCYAPETPAFVMVRQKDCHKVRASLTDYVV